MSVQSSIDNLIAQHQIAIFSKTYCPYCDATKSCVVLPSSRQK